MKKIVRFFLISVLCLTSLTACKTKYGSIPDEQEVLEKVNATIENENFELVGKEEVDSSPKKCIYTFRSTDRDLEFQATSTLELRKFLSDSTLDYKGVVEVNYVEAVKALYAQEMIDELKKTGLYEDDREGFLIHNDEELFIVWEALYEADQIYAKEKEYNSENWMKKNPALKVELDFIIDGEAYSGTKICLTGIMSKEEIKEEIDEIEAHTKKYMCPLGDGVSGP